MLCQNPYYKYILCFVKSLTHITTILYNFIQLSVKKSQSIIFPFCTFLDFLYQLCTRLFKFFFAYSDTTVQHKSSYQSKCNQAYYNCCFHFITSQFPIPAALFLTDDTSLKARYFRRSGGCRQIHNRICFR